MKKLVTFLLALVASVSAIYAQSGTCGNNLTWELNAETGVLTISGTGAMKNYFSSSNVPWYDYRSSIKSVIISDGVISIGSYAFGYCSSLTSITIPNSVTSIGDDAFRQCSSLTSVTIPNSVTSIGSYAFGYCSSLTSVTIPKSVTSIGDYTFWYCESLTSVIIPNSVTMIGYAAFYECSSLTSITIPNSVTSIGGSTFSGCSSLTSINVDSNNPNYSSVDGVLFNKDKTTLIQYPGGKQGAYTIPNSVTSIGSSAFSGCSSLTSITIPNSVTSIGGSTFSGCSSLTSVTIPKSVTSIGEGAFSGCSSLTSITIPKSVTSIGDKTFSGCSSLTSITIPKSVASIGNSAFEYCSSLTSITIPNSVTSIGWCVFSSCSSLTSIYVDTNNPNYCSIDGVLFNKDKTTLIQYPIGSTRTEYTIPNSVTMIGYEAFYCCDLISVTLPNNLTSIEYNAFGLCYSLTSVTLPNSLTSIGESAFYWCTSLTSITIPNSVTSIGRYAFSGTGVYRKSNWENGVLYVNNCLIAAEENISGAYVIKKGTRLIAGGAFSGCSSLTSVTIPNSVTSIGDRTFSGCSSLASVTIPNSVTSIGEYAFSSCKSLTSVTIPNSVTSIGYMAFGYCSSLTSVTVGNSVTRIGSFAFGYCSSLTSVTIGNSVTSIGNYAFAYDDALVAINVEQGNRAYSSVDGVLYNRDKTVIIAYPTGKTNNSYTILDGVNTIDTCAFIGNEYLEYINMPKTLISIDYRAFEDCTKLIEIVIPKTVRTIGSYTFYNCASLKKIYNNAIIPQEIDDKTFEKVDILNCELYVMPMAFTNYYNANIWKDFGLIETIEIGGIDIDDSKLEFTTTQKQANVLWAANSKATLYLLSMRRVGSEDTYTFTFDENGYLISSDTNSLDFSKLIYLQNAAYSLTITDFDTDATYVYSFLYKDNEGNILHSESGQFSPDEFLEGIENVQGNEVQSTKVIKDGQVLILRNGKTYTMQGVEVK